MQENSKEKSEEISLDFLKKINWKFLLLFAFLLLGIYLRCYHLDFPAIGYHNMKENEYIDQAVFFMQKGDYLHKQAFAFFGLDEGTGYHEEYGQMPLVPYMLFAIWSVFGESLVSGRLLMIAFFMGAVFVLYFLMKRLTKSEYLSILSTGLMTIMPLGIYFGRNIQPEPPAIFFSLLAILFYVKWIDDSKSKDLFYATLFLGIAGLFKYTFLIFAVPILFIFPYKEFYHKFMKERKKAVKDLLNAFYGFVPFILGVIVYEYLTIVDPWKKNYDVEPFRVFTSQYWAARGDIIVSFLRDNYTMWFVVLALIGVLLVSLKYKTRFGKFMIGYFLSILPYILMISSKLAGHSYYQMPFLPLVCIASAYALYFAGALLNQIFNNKLVFYVPLIIIFLAVPSMQAANDRVFGTVFYGQDFLGNYLKTRMLPDERLIEFTHVQDLATCSYAQHRCAPTQNLTEFKHKEEFFNIRYVYVGTQYFQDLISSNDSMWVYIRQNYGTDLVGLMPYNNQLSPVHFILKRGHPFNLADMQGKQPTLAQTYKMKFGNVQYYYIQVVR